MTAQRYFEDFTVGDRFKSPSRTLTDAHFMFFAGMTGDNHPIHHDEEYGKKTRYGGRLAHGLLLVSMMTGMAPISAQAVVALYGFEKIRFVKPVLLGDTITYTSKIAALEPKGDGRGVADVEFQICNQHNAVCVAGTIKLLLHKTPRS